MIGHDKDKAVNPFNPFFSMWMAITRQNPGGEGDLPGGEDHARTGAADVHERVGLSALQREDDGVARAGKYADLVMIDRDLLTCAEDEIRHIQPLATVVEGKLVYGTL